MPYKDKDKKREHYKKYREKNKDKIAAGAKKFYEENKNKVKEWHKNYYEKNKDNLAVFYKKQYEGYKAAWIEIIKSKGMNRCSRCGYDKCFAVLQFHHINQQEKEYKIGNMFASLPSEKKIKELDKCICLCANCHGEEHHLNNSWRDVVRRGRCRNDA